MSAGGWDRKKFTGVELEGKILGVVGLGNVGSIVASRGIGLGMRVVGYDPFLSRESAAALGIDLLDLDEVIAAADVLSLHVPLNDRTRGLIGEAELKRMKPSAFLINCARGGIVDEAALDAAVSDGVIAGAAVDVFDGEPPAEDNPLRSNPGIVVTPHLGASTIEAQVKVGVAIAHQVVDILTTGEVRNALNAPSVSAEVLERLGPYLVLGERLGSLVGQVHSGPVEKVSIRFAGDIAADDTRPMEIQVLKGLLGSGGSDLMVNEVNARAVARERGLRVETSVTADAEDYSATVRIRLEGGGTSTQATGAVFGRSDSRIISLDGYRLESMPVDHPLVLISNRDVPGMIGSVGAAFGANGINIARCTSVAKAAWATSP